jgi:hypothetical protein
MLRSVRGYGVATQALRGLPDFLIIGGKRCGTTSLYWHLVQHPSVLPLFPRAKRIKGVHFFDWNYDRGVDWYRSHFPSAPARKLTSLWRRSPAIAGEASSTYLFHPMAPERALEVVPGAGLIVLLRDPVERAWSHYRTRARLGKEPLSFEDAVSSEPERLAGEREHRLLDPSYRSYPLEQQAYVGLGLYLEPLKLWMERFPKRRVLVLRSEDFSRDPGRTYLGVLGFLGLPPWTPPGFRAMNASPPGDLMPERIRAELCAMFAPHNERLAEHLQMDLGWGGTQ